MFIRTITAAVVALAAQAAFAANYYDQFLFQVQGNCNKIETVWFHATHSWEYAKLGYDDQGRPVQATASIQLFPDGKYWVEYAEEAIKKVNPNSTEYDRLFSTTFEGTWLVKGDRIELRNLGYGVPAKFVLGEKQYDSFKFTLTQKINDERAVNKIMNVARSGTNTGPRGISINQYCGRH